MAILSALVDMYGDYLFFGNTPLVLSDGNFYYASKPHRVEIQGKCQPENLEYLYSYFSEDKLRTFRMLGFKRETFLVYEFSGLIIELGQATPFQKWIPITLSIQLIAPPYEIEEFLG